ncbi:MAG: FecR domain-containing protein [Dyadobacter sp.]|uniref:FecR family protein n=1 Tax=Dyadobacter sp. TaxID=1914288 RepID=UPI001B2E5B32|nr:FecR domain-containing protein [Dyadobacter sp.]MBO9611300.1 FecR domain-containing protein [Dyadobacter sp.]
MQDYAQYDIKDFLADEAFCRWVLRQQPADNAFWENWLRNNPERAGIVSKAKTLISEIHHAQNYLSDEELETELQRLSAARKSATRDPEYSEPTRRWLRPVLLGTGALACVVVLFFIFSNPLSWQTGERTAHVPSKVYKSEKWIEITNDGNSTKSVSLPDGSSVRLSPKSRFSYPAKFVKTGREVLLNGEAFFEVTKNPQSPFKVYTSDIVTTVLGTSFTVKAFDGDKDVRVVVKTGKVTVTANTARNKTREPEKTQLVLLPNQQVVFHRDEQTMKRSLVGNPSPVGQPNAGTLVFENAPVARVFESLQKQYEVQIIYDADLLAGCQLTAELGQEPLFEKLGMICKAIQARYELIDGQIIIQGSSCR